MSCEFDVIIAGGGVMGSACAYFMSGMGGFHDSVAVVEPDPTYRHAASSRSASSIRRQFSTPMNIALSTFGMEFLRDAPRLLSRGGVPIDVGLTESSYLYLATAAGRTALGYCVDVQQRCGVPVTLHTRPGLAARYPWLNTEDLWAGADTAGGEGWFDGYALLTALRQANEDRGVRYLHDRPTTHVLLVLVGPGVARAVEQVQELDSRVSRRIHVKELGHQQLHQLLPRLHPVLASTAQQVLVDLAQSAKGNLRRWARVLEIAEHLGVQADSGISEVMAGHILRTMRGGS